MHGTRTTLGYTTTIFGAGELKVFPQDPQQGGVGCGVGHGRFAVDIECGGHALILESCNIFSLNRHRARIYQRFP
jgi:hypothetical protein